MTPLAPASYLAVVDFPEPGTPRIMKQNFTICVEFQ